MAIQFPDLPDIYTNFRSPTFFLRLKLKLISLGIEHFSKLYFTPLIIDEGWHSIVYTLNNNLSLSLRTDYSVLNLHRLSLSHEAWPSIIPVLMASSMFTLLRGFVKICQIVFQAQGMTFILKNDSTTKLLRKMFTL